MQNNPNLRISVCLPLILTRTFELTEFEFEFQFPPILKDRVEAGNDDIDTHPKSVLKPTPHISNYVLSTAIAIGRGLEPLDSRTDPRTRLNWW
jgi:hypothetical protein